MLLTRIWNHKAKMRTAFAEKKIAWPHLNAQDMTDLLVYLQNQPHTRQTTMRFSLAPADSGKPVFRPKGAPIAITAGSRLRGIGAYQPHRRGCGDVEPRPGNAPHSPTA